MTPEQMHAVAERVRLDAELLDSLLALVSDWQANGNSRELGDPRADVWQACARQLLETLNPDGAEVEGREAVRPRSLVHRQRQHAAVLNPHRPEGAPNHER